MADQIILDGLGVRGLGGGQQGDDPEEDKRQRAGQHRAPQTGTGLPGLAAAARSGESPWPGGRRLVRAGYVRC